jgi:hypothetical protein
MKKVKFTQNNFLSQLYPKSVYLLSYLLSYQILKQPNYSYVTRGNF